MIRYFDSDGREWTVLDVHIHSGAHEKRRVALGSGHADGRVFKRGDDVRVHWFGSRDDRGTGIVLLKIHFRNARPVAMTDDWHVFDEAPGNRE